LPRLAPRGGSYLTDRALNHLLKASNPRLITAKPPPPGRLFRRHLCSIHTAERALHGSALCRHHPQRGSIHPLPQGNPPPTPHQPPRPRPGWHGAIARLYSHRFQTHPVLVVDDLHQAAMFGLDRRGGDGFLRLWWFGCFFLQLLLWKERGEEEGESQRETQPAPST